MYGVAGAGGPAVRDLRPLTVVAIVTAFLVVPDPHAPYVLRHPR